MEFPDIALQIDLNEKNYRNRQALLAIRKVGCLSCTLHVDMFRLTAAIMPTGVLPMSAFLLVDVAVESC